MPLAQYESDEQEPDQTYLRKVLMSAKTCTEEEIWTTNVMIIYVESEDYNITTVRILEEMDRVERGLNTVRDDNGQNDDIIMHYRYLRW